MNILLHAGLHRCATTAFQFWLEAERANLAGAGIAVLTPQSTPGTPFSALARNAARASPAAAGAARLEAWLRDYVAEIAGRSEWLVVSEENLFGPMPGVRPRLMAGLDAGAAILRRALPDAEIHVLVALREPKRFLASAYKFRLSVGDVRPPEAFAVSLDPAGLSFRTLFDRLVAAFGRERVALVDFERIVATQGEEYIDRAERITGRAWPHARPLPIANETYPDVIAAAVATLNEAGLGIGKAAIQEGCALADALRRPHNAAPDIRRDLADRLAAMLATSAVPMPRLVTGQARFGLAERLGRMGGGRLVSRAARERIAAAVQAAAAGGPGVADALWNALPAESRTRLVEDYEALKPLTAPESEATRAAAVRSGG
ncbi:hypothetical protein ACUN0C_16065 [Faunimonas sp. B44]|uniref:hypothetical protein n=1 Tax=Faunimonas sp. B44 TaxID=3461493 RepID=UPI00404484BA